MAEKEVHLVKACGNIDQFLKEHVPDLKDGNGDCYWWFSNKAKAVSLYKKLDAFHDVGVAYYNGPACLKRAVATVTLSSPGFPNITCGVNFGYGISGERAEASFHEGEYSCDCGRARLLNNQGFPYEVTDCCSNEIRIVKLDVKEVDEVAPPK